VGGGPGTVSKANADGTFVVKPVNKTDGAEYVQENVPAEHVGKSSSSGRTLSIRPKQRTAVVHFPQSTSLQCDVRAMHEGANAIDEKWILATWMCVVIVSIAPAPIL
jgi:hypothetical protein